jgi:pimeloyl-ACP methyl ester carboxylesterase
MDTHLEACTVMIPVGAAAIDGELHIPDGARGIVIFAHGSGSSRYSPRNKYVAGVLNRSGFATLLIDLLTMDEERVDIATDQYRFDIELLAERLVIATDWVVLDSRLLGLPVGYFGASTGAAAALVAASKRTPQIRTIVSRGGRPDMAADALSKVITPTLFIVGEFDDDVIELNQEAARRMQPHTEIKIVPGATHLFEEEGALEQVASLAREWFEANLPRQLAA